MNPEKIGLICISIGVVSLLLLAYIRGRKAISIFPDTNSINVLFREKGVSGIRKHKNLLKKGVANRVLEIIVTDEELWIKTRTIMAGTLERIGLLHKLTFNKIKSCTENGSQIELIIDTNQDEDTNLVFTLKNPKKFIEIMAQKLHTTY